MPLAVGDRAPDFTLPDQTGAPVRLSSFLAKGPVVLYFDPKDETPGCTAEACAFRDQYADFVDAGASVIGVSDDSVATHAAFAAHHRLPFTLVSDADRALEKSYGVKRTLGLIPGRVTFVIDPQGIVRNVTDDRLRATKHVSDSARMIRELRVVQPS